MPSNQLIWLFAIVICVLLGLALLRAFFDKWFPLRKYLYRKKDFLMTRGEHQFFDILEEVVGNKYYLFPQIHLSTILDHKAKGQSWMGAFMHINQKSVDYVICDKNYIKPLLAIELDDKSHERADRQERDVEVERILNGAGLPLLRVPERDSYDKVKLSQEIDQKILK